jgi:hypothetical protein
MGDIMRAVDIIKSVAKNGDTLDVGMLVEAFKEARADEREGIARYVEENAVLLSGHVRKPWVRLAAEIRAGCRDDDDRPTQAIPREGK